MRVLTIVVPFPPGGKWLSTNSNRHLHPHAQAKRVQPWRTSAAALAEGKTPFAGPVAVVATIHKARRNRWDIDGITPTVKACVDGLRDAGVLTEDDDQHITRLTLQVGAVDPRAPRLVLSVHEADEMTPRPWHDLVARCCTASTNHCHATVTRRGWEDACGKPPVALVAETGEFAASDGSPTYWPACAWHANRCAGSERHVLSLMQIMAAVRQGGAA